MPKRQNVADKGFLGRKDDITTGTHQREDGGEPSFRLGVEDASPHVVTRASGNGSSAVSLLYLC